MSFTIQQAHKLIRHRRPLARLPAVIPKPAPTADVANIGVILTVYKRPQNLAAQLDAVMTQTIKPSEILIWNNSGQPLPLPVNIPTVTAQPNMGVWPRFMIGLEMSSDYLCIFDDDTIPGLRWFENCINTMKTHRGVLGTVGVTFKNETRQGHYKGDSWTRVGWPNSNNTPVEVDIVGHSWFIERDWLRSFAAEPRCGGTTCGEDYHLSVSAQKQLGLKTYVPPHPETDKSLWGSLKGMDLGTDNAALYKQTGETEKKARAHAAYVAGGWKPICMKGNEWT